MVANSAVQFRGSRWALLSIALNAGSLAGAYCASAELKGSGIKGAVTVTPTQSTAVDEASFFAFDDVSIPFTSNLYLTMHPPEKYPGNPVVPLGKIGEPDEWQQRYYGTVLRHEGKFKMWYIAASKEAFITPSRGGPIDYRGWRFVYAESEDGIHWKKPNLGLVEFRGNRDNNLILMPPGFTGYHTLVLHEPEEPDPTRRFKMMALILPTLVNSLPRS